MKFVDVGPDRAGIDKLSALATELQICDHLVKQAGRGDAWFNKRQDEKAQIERRIADWWRRNFIDGDTFTLPDGRIVRVTFQLRDARKRPAKHEPDPHDFFKPHVEVLVAR